MTVVGNYGRKRIRGSEIMVPWTGSVALDIKESDEEEINGLSLERCVASSSGSTDSAPAQGTWITASAKKRRNQRVDVSRFTQKRSLVVNPTACPRLNQLHHLIVSAINGHAARDRWFTLSGRLSGVLASEPVGESKCLMVVVPYLDQDTVEEYCNKTATPFIDARKIHVRSAKKMFLRGTSRSCSVLEATLDGGDGHVGSRVSSAPEASSKPADFSAVPRRLSSLLLTAEEIEVNGYPVEFAGWQAERPLNYLQAVEKIRQAPKAVCTVDSVDASERVCHTVSRFSPTHFNVFKDDPDLPRLLGLDCEMCVTDRGKEVVRISVVKASMLGVEPGFNQPGTAEPVASVSPVTPASEEPSMVVDVVLDTLVQPEHAVVDYLTRYSGVTAKDLEGVDVTIDDVRDCLSKLISPETILVGHSLENDLRCLGIFHSKIIDTAVAYRHPHPPLRHSLRFLAFEYLGGLAIQGRRQNGERGHNSVEDAAIPIELALLKSCSPLSATDRDDHRISIPLGKRLGGPINLYDAMDHDLTQHPLAYVAQNVRLIPLVERTDEAAVRTCVQELRRARRLSRGSCDNEKTEASGLAASSLQSGDARLHMCFLRKYQRMVHQAVGGTLDVLRPRDVYNVSKRVSRWVAMCVARATQTLPMSLPAPALEPDVPSPPDTSDWLKATLESTSLVHENGCSQGALGASRSGVEVQTTVTNSEPQDDGDEEDDVLGKQWCERLIQQCPIKDPHTFFPPVAEKALKQFLKELDANLAVLYESLDPGDLMVVVSGCGNPILSLGLGCLQKCLISLSEFSRHDLSAYIDYNSSFGHAKIQADTKFGNPFCCLFLK